MATIKRSLKRLHDPSHSWLSVSLKDIITLGIENEISTCSYMNAKRAFLEEDNDMWLFLDAAKKEVWEVTYSDSITDNSHYVRNYPTFNPYFAKYPLTPGSKVTIEISGVQGVIKNMNVLVCQYGNCYRLRSNPLIGLTPPSNIIRP